MRIITLIAVVLLMISCDQFEKAEMSECLNGTAEVKGFQPKTEITEETDEMVLGDEENDDSDVVEDEQVTKVILIEKTESEISFYYQSYFSCSGMEYGYEIKSNSSDETVLDLRITSHDTTPNSNVKCVCYKKMTVEYESGSQDLTKITKIKIVGEDYEEVLEFDEDGDDEPQEDADTVSDEDVFVPECAKLSEEECAVTSGCETITGRPFNNEKQCWEQYATIGCMVAGPCNQMITYGYSPAGKCYWFNDMCIPDGWNYARENDEQCGISLSGADKCF